MTENKNGKDIRPAILGEGNEPSVEELTARLKELYGESYIELCSTGLGDVHAVHVLDPNCKVVKCDWIDEQCTRDPNRCSLAPKHCPIWHEKVGIEHD